MSRFPALTSALALFLLIGAAARADEPLFGFVYTTDLLPKGQKEIEQWVTLREGRSQGDFHLLQTRTEVSYGLRDNLQVSGYLNLAWTDAYRNTPRGDTAPPEVFADYHFNPDKRFDHARLESVSAEALYRVASPYTAPVGVAVYVEPSLGPRTVELESRLILQKNFMDDRLVFAANATVGFELRRLHADPDAAVGSVERTDHWDRETDVNYGVAGSYRFRPNWSAGLELQNERELAGFNPFLADHRTNYAWYTGPTLHYAARHIFVTGTVLFQLPWARDFANSGPDSVVVHGISNGDDFENLRFRLKAGYYF